MALNDVSFVLNQKGLGGSLPNEDNISGIIFYKAAGPTGFPTNVTNGGIVKCFQVQDAENVGIVNDYSDETQASATYTITGVGAAGDIIKLYTQEPINPTNNGPNPNKVLLVSYTVTAADTTVTLLAASITAALNVNSITSGGYTATSSVGAITIVSRKGLGVFLNSGSPFSATITGTVTGTIVQYTGGVASKYAIYHYHISEFFRMNPTGVLYVGIFALPGTLTAPTFAEVTTMQQFSDGKIRQIGMYCDFNAFLTAFVTAAQVVATALDTDHMPLSLVIGAEISASSLSTVSGLNLAALSSRSVSVNISQDGAAQGFALYKAYSKSITNLGNMMGVISAAKVSQSIADGTAFNISNGTENEVAGFANGTLFSAQSTSLITTLNNVRFIFTRKAIGINGTFYNDSHCCILRTNAYGYIYQNRTVAKIERLLYAAYFPYVSTQLGLNADGTLSDTSVANLESVGEQTLDQMVTAQEISGKSITIDQTQNVPATGKLVITLNEVPQLIINNIEIGINQVASL